MSVRIEGIGAAAAAVSSAIGAILDWPIAFGVAGVLAVAVTVSYLSSKRSRGEGVSGGTVGQNSAVRQNKVKSVALSR